MGLELVDGCILLFTFFVTFLINRNGLFTNCFLLVLVYIGLRALKRGKPEGYILILLRFALVSRFKRIPQFEESELPR